MEIPTEARDKILFEITSDDREARGEYLKRFEAKQELFPPPWARL
jgi:hypothetical protein